MPRGKNTNVYLTCKGTLKKEAAKGKNQAKNQLSHNDDGCNMQNYKTRINKRTIEGKLERVKYCSTCKKATVHVSGSEIKHSS